MLNLLNANFVRLKKSKLFWTFCVLAFLWGVYMCFLINDSIKTYGESYLTTIGGVYLLMPLFYIAPVEAIFCGFFIGTDYSDGTIRNKLFIGHKRADIYLSSFILASAVGLCLCLIHFAAMVVVGLPLIGPLIFTSVAFPLLRIACGILIVILTSAVFTALCMLNSNKSHALVAGIILSVVMISAGTGVYAALSEPEFYSYHTISPNGEITSVESVPNPQYVDGPAHDVLEWIDASLPFSASLDIMVPSEEMPPVRIPLCQAGLTVILTSAGIAAFKRKNIK